MKQYKYKIDGAQYDVTISEIKGANATLIVNGIAFDVQMLGTPISESDLPDMAAASASEPTSSVSAAHAEASVDTQSGDNSAGAGSPIKAPLPGVIVGVNVSVGDSVKKGQTLLVLEAMKMENNINAESDGTITGVCVKKGDSVMEGTILVTIA